jgi:hypothetical protein
MNGVTEGKFLASMVDLGLSVHDKQHNRGSFSKNMLIWAQCELRSEGNTDFVVHRKEYIMAMKYIGVVFLIWVCVICAGYGQHVGPTSEQISLAGLLDLGSPRNLLNDHGEQNMSAPGSAPPSSGLAHLFNQDIPSRFQAGNTSGVMESRTVHSNSIPSPRTSRGHCSTISGIGMSQQGTVGLNGLSQNLPEDSAMQFGGYGPPDGARQVNTAPSAGDELAKLAQLYNPARSGGNASLDSGRQSWGGVGDSGAENGPLHGAHAMDGGEPPQQDTAVGGDSNVDPPPEGMWSLAATDVQDLLMRFQTPTDMDVGETQIDHRGSTGRVSGNGDIGSDRTAVNAMQYMMQHGGSVPVGEEDCVNRTASQSGVGGAGDVDIPAAPSAGGEDDLTQFLNVQT